MKSLQLFFCASKKGGLDKNLLCLFQNHSGLAQRIWWTSISGILTTANDQISM